jgi:hypothetical protein
MVLQNTPIIYTHPVLSWCSNADGEEHRVTPVTTGGILDQIRPWYLLDTNQIRYRPRQLTIFTTTAVLIM